MLKADIVEVVREPTPQLRARIRELRAAPAVVFDSDAFWAALIGCAEAVPDPVAGAVEPPEPSADQEPDECVTPAVLARAAGAKALEVMLAFRDAGMNVTMNQALDAHMLGLLLVAQRREVERMRTLLEAHALKGAIGWMRLDGTLHAGCPPLAEPEGWKAVFLEPAAQTVSPQADPPARWGWACNECGAMEYTSSVSEEDLDRLACGGCGSNEFHRQARGG